MNRRGEGVSGRRGEIVFVVFVLVLVVVLVIVIESDPKAHVIDYPAVGGITPP